MLYEVQMERIARRRNVRWRIDLPTVLAEADLDQLEYELEAAIRRQRLLASNEFGVSVELDGVDNTTASIRVDGGRFGEGVLVPVQSEGAAA